MFIWVTTDHSMSKRAQAFCPSVDMKQSSKTKVSCFFDISSWKTLSMTEKSIEPFLSNANPLRMLSGRTDSCTNAETLKKLREDFSRVLQILAAEKTSLLRFSSQVLLCFIGLP